MQRISASSRRAQTTASYTYAVCLPFSLEPTLVTDRTLKRTSTSHQQQCSKCRVSPANQEKRTNAVLCSSKLPLSFSKLPVYFLERKLVYLIHSTAFVETKSTTHPMKTMFLAVAARVSGSRGFSEACPQPAHTASTRQRSAISTISITGKNHTQTKTKFKESERASEHARTQAGKQDARKQPSQPSKKDRLTVAKRPPCVYDPST